MILPQRKCNQREPAKSLIFVIMGPRRTFSDSHVVNQIIRRLSKRAALRAAARHTRQGGFFDVRFGFALMRDSRIPVGSKLLALGVGVAITAALVGFELPLEALLGIFAPLLGFAADVMIDGLEIVVLPLVFACLFVPHLVSRSTLEVVRLEGQPRR